MRGTRVTGVAVAIGLLAAGWVAAQPAEPTTYTFVAEWQVPRAQWETFVADFDKNTRPVLEQLAGGGTLVGWGAYENIVHMSEGPSHGVWWSSNTLAGIERARGELMAAAAASTSLSSAQAHRDYLFQTLIGNGNSGSGTNGYLSVSSFMLKPMQGRDWRQLWEKHTRPTMDDLVAKGLLVGYSVDAEYVHTTSPGLRMIVTLSPDAEAVDKVDAAFEAASASRSEEERRQIGEAFTATLEPGAHRDGYMRVIRYWNK